MSETIRLLEEPTDFGDQEYSSALVLVTNACNLSCRHCFVYREGTPNNPKDKIRDETFLYQLEKLRDKHKIRSMLFMGGEPMIKSALVFEAMKLFDQSSIVTNGTYGIPSVPGHLVTVSLDGPKAYNDAIRGEGVFEKVKQAVFNRVADGTTVMLQMTLTRENAPAMEAFVEEVHDWPVDGIAFTFYVPQIDQSDELTWDDLRERDEVVDRLIELKKTYPIIKANVDALEMMYSHRCLEATGLHGEKCSMKNMLPLYIGDGGCFERTFCCYGNNVDCSRCGAYAVFNNAFRKSQADAAP